MEAMEGTEHAGESLLGRILTALAFAGFSGCGGSTGHPIETEASPPEGDQVVVVGENREASTSDEMETLPDVPASRLGDSGIDRSASVEEPTDGPEREARSIIASGRRYCETSRECFGLFCEVGPNSTRGVCVVPCTSNDDCERQERCIEGEGFAAACFTTCSEPSQCAYEFDCIDYRGDGIYNCLPSPWVISSRDM
jgi:hypothetical protein